MWPKPNGNANVVFDLDQTILRKKQKLNTCHEIIGKKKISLRQITPQRLPWISTKLPYQ